MAKRIAGTCYVKVNGEQLSLNGSMTCTMSDVNREAVLGSNGVAGYSESPVAPSIIGTFNVTTDFPLETLMDTTDMTVTAELANGMVYTISDAFVSGETNYSASDGNISLTFVGMRGSWQ